jgi:hypothetical protein
VLQVQQALKEHRETLEPKEILETKEIQVQQEHMEILETKVL